jgi:hypothetical protein
MLTAPVITGNAVPFSGEKTITVKGTLALGAATAIGATVVNEGTVSTATTSAAALNTLIGAVGKGTVSATGALTAFDAAITVPEGVTLTTASSATFATGAGGEGGLTVNGTLTADDAPPLPR